jgi:hypothetical protein
MENKIQELKEHRREIRVALGFGQVTNLETQQDLIKKEAQLTKEIKELENQA